MVTHLIREHIERLGQSSDPSPPHSQAQLEPPATAHVPALKGRPFSISQELDLHNYWRVIRKHLLLIMACWLGAVLLCVAHLATVTPQYTASSTLMIEPRAAQIYNLRDALTQLPSAEFGEHDYYKTQYDILDSQSLAAQVISAQNLRNSPLFAPSKPGLFSAVLGSVRSGVIGLFFHPIVEGSAGQNADQNSRDYPDVSPGLIGAYLGRLSVKPKLGTTLVVLSFTSPDPVLSARIVNAHAREFIRKGVELRAQAGHNAQEFLDQKMLDAQQRVEASEAALNQYRREHGIVTFSLTDKGETLMQRLKDLGSDLTRAATTRINLESQHQLIVNGEYEALPEVIDNALITALKSETAKMAEEYASLSNRFNPGYHPLDDLKAKLDEDQARLKQQVRQVAASVEASYQASLAAENKIQQEIDSVKHEAMVLNEASVQDAVLARQVDSNRELYKALLQRSHEVGLSADVPASNVSVVDRARPPHAPSSPKVMQSLALSGAVGLFGGIGLAFLLDALDDNLKSPREVEQYLSLPTIGSVPDFAKLGHGGRGYAYYGYRSRGRPAPPDPLDAARPAHSKELVVTERTTVAGEAYRAIRTALIFSRAGSPPQTILLTSSLLGEGKTVTVVNVSVAFCQLGGRILLIDADLRRPRCHKVLNLENGIGLCDVLVGQVEAAAAIRPTNIPGLFLLSAGTATPSPAELLGSRQMAKLLMDLRRDFDHVFVDSPPVMPVSDAVALSTMVDGVLVIVSTRTPKQAAQEACDRLRYVGAKLLGVLLNKLDVSSPDYQYYHRYSYRYSYSYYESYERRENEAANSG